MTGAGKTNLLETVAEQDILRGVTIIFIHSKGDKKLLAEPPCFYSCRSQSGDDATGGFITSAMADAIDMHCANEPPDQNHTSRVSNIYK